MIISGANQVYQHKGYQAQRKKKKIAAQSAFIATEGLIPQKGSMVQNDRSQFAGQEDDEHHEHYDI